MNRKYKILILPHNYYPDVASIGQLYTELAESLAHIFDITVLCQIPNYTGNTNEKYKKATYYKEIYNDVTINRIITKPFDKSKKISRIINLIYYFRDFRKITKKLNDYDLVLTTSAPPIIGGIMGRIAAKNCHAKLIYNIQDFNPEQMEAVHFHRIPFLNKILKVIDNKSIKKSNSIIIVSKEMEKTLLKRMKNHNLTYDIIHNWTDTKKIYPINRDDPKIIDFKVKNNIPLNQTIIGYSGNLGLYYDLDVLLVNLAKIKSQDVTILFIGEGAIKQRLMNYATLNKLNNVMFLPYQKKENLHISLNVIDIHLITHIDRISGVSFPSKLYGILATNKPFIAIGAAGGDLNAVIDKLDDCLFIDYRYINHLADKIDRYLKVFNSSASSGGNDYILNNYSKESAIFQYKNLVIETIERNKK